MANIFALGAAIIRDGRILLVRTRRHPKTWQFPGGIWETGEKVMDGLSRELREELPGIRFKIYRLVGIYWGKVYKDGVICLQVYRVNLWTKQEASELRLGDELLEARWVDDTDELNLANPTAQAIAILKKRGDL